MNIRKINALLLLSIVALFITLAGTTAVNAQIHQQQQERKQLHASPPTIFPDIEKTVKTLNDDGCFWVTIQGGFFTPSNSDNSQYVDLYATDLTNDSLIIHPWYTQIRSDGTFSKAFYVCGLSSSLNLVTFVAMDDNTGVSSNPLPVAITPFTF